ncbi:SDR family oxidoreductase [Pseudomonas sp. 15A4]|uniref:SDR family NAD(P)-dependent oxidoreductase n=1 Tax=Pseudomonas sp. 15A4 TaxID=2804761 RepID=UPI001967D4DB|nr:SDR family oxidoreductase [Pseudomonas sp. 15A4]QSB20134.1 SDR family oxidoreductase [Pseudomonas sp. 15A4]
MSDQAMSAPAANHDLRARVAVVTGAAGGIGQAIARTLGKRGAKIVLLDLNISTLRPVEDALMKESIEVVSIACDISNEIAVKASAEQVKSTWGGCDILVNNAGILPPPCPLESVPQEEVLKALSVNLGSMFLTSRYFGAHMLTKGKGSIINIGSTAAHSPNSSAPYSVSKAGVLALTRHTAVEWGPRGIRANTVSPGFIRTPLSESQYTDELYSLRLGMIPLRRLGTTEDIAFMVAFLASDEAAYVSGQDLTIDGGFLQTTLMHAQRHEHQYGGICL